jgi:hypothetical protein
MTDSPAAVPNSAKPGTVTIVVMSEVASAPGVEIVVTRIDN